MAVISIQLYSSNNSRLWILVLQNPKLVPKHQSPKEQNTKFCHRFIEETSEKPFLSTFIARQWTVAAVSDVPILTSIE